MRMFDQINRGRFSLHAVPLADPLPTDISLTESVLRTAVRQCVRVTADECQLWLTASWDVNWSYATQCGPLRLPFASMWIEWVIPDEDGGSGLPVAAWVEAADPPAWAPDGAEQMLKCVLFAEQFSKVIYVPSMLTVFTGEHGSYLGMRATENPDEEAPQAYTSMFMPGMLAIGLMNCRNVKIAEARDHAAVPRKPKQKARIPKPLAYHTIVVPGARRPKSSAEARELAGEPLPWHIVRGHFKTYTADAPLMGKHVGTYWWSPAVRGDRDDGVIEKDYRVVPPAE
jgi:hypothetical protein